MKPRVNLSKIQKVLIIAFLIVFISLVTVRNYYFIKLDYGPKDSDNQFHKSILYYRVLVLKEKMSLRSIFYPPIGYLNAVLFYILFEPTVESSRFSISLFLIVFLLAMFGIGYELNGLSSAYVTIALAASSLFVLNISVRFLLDLPCTAMVAASLFFLLKSDFFRKKKWALMFGFCFALALLTKNFVSVFIGFPILWFLAPNIFKSIRSFLIFIMLLVPVLIMTGGSIWFVNKHIKLSTGFVVEDKWFMFYALFVLLPACILSIVAFVTEKKYSRVEEKDKDAIMGLTNFSYAYSIFTSLSLIWYYWTVRSNLLYFDLQKRDQIESLDNVSYLSKIVEGLGILRELVMYSFNFAPLLLLVGIVFLIIKREKLYRNLSIPLGFLVPAVLLMATLHFQFRYLLPLIVFIIALAGFWIDYTGRLKIYLTILILSASLISIFVWVPVSPEGEIFIEQHKVDLRPAEFNARIIYPNPPDSTEIYSKRVIKHLFSNDKKHVKRVILYHFYESDLLYFYYLQGEALRDDRILAYQDIWGHQEYFNPLNGEREFSLTDLKDFNEKVDYLLVIHRQNNHADICERAYRKLIPSAKFERKTFMLGEKNIKVTVSRILKDQKHEGSLLRNEKN